MNFKQKLVYMFIGCLFTIAGYILASLGGNATHAQQFVTQPLIVRIPKTDHEKIATAFYVTSEAQDIIERYHFGYIVS